VENLKKSLKDPEILGPSKDFIYPIFPLQLRVLLS